MNINWSDKKQNKFFCFYRDHKFVFSGLESKFVIFIGTENLFNPRFNDERKS